MLRLPSLRLTKKERDEILKQTQPLVTHEIAQAIIDSLYLSSLMFHKRLWSEDLRERAANIRYIKKHPEEFRSRERSAFACLRLFGPKDNDRNSDDARDVTPPKKMTVEQLRQMGFTDTQLKQIAGIEEEEGKP